MDCTRFKLYNADVAIYNDINGDVIGVGMEESSGNSRDTMSDNDESVATGIEEEVITTTDIIAEVPMAMTAAAVFTNNYCGESWGEVAVKCASLEASGVQSMVEIELKLCR